MQNINNNYNHNAVEKNKSAFWSKKKYFSSHNKKLKPFSIIMPPPNITGKLHIGHAWDLSLQDLMIRYKKLNNFDVLFVPGMDHAGIATEIKVENHIKEKYQLIKKNMTKDEFISHIWKWKKEYSNIIRNQWEKLGLGLDLKKELFTFDKNSSKIVQKVFLNLYNKNLIYRDKKMIFWDPKLKTAISNIEVVYKEQNDYMYYIKYFLDNGDFLSVATTRPETIFGDSALIVNPNDKRYKKYINKNVINPLTFKKIPILTDNYVDINYGTGIMKCSPAHDFNDFIIGKKNNLKIINCIDENMKLTAISGRYVGLDRFIARKQIVKDLKADHKIVKIAHHANKIGISQRSGAIVEPLLSNQWFISMKKIAKKIITQQNKKDAINFFPTNFNNTLITWMNNIEDWCISRQILWGHQIPIWYNKNDPNKISVILQNSLEWEQEKSVLDTWFSSSLWPLIALGWNKNKKLFNRYFPSDFLVTGYDIIFFWVSRMMGQSLQILEHKPFKNILIHGLIRDENGHKMSKSLNNGIDPNDVIKQKGADTLRFFLLTNTTPGQDLRYSEEKINSSWRFINKIWNISLFILHNKPTKFKYYFDIKMITEDINIWILSKFSIFQKQWFINMDRCEFSIAAKDLIHFIMDNFCSAYIELSKINFNQKNAQDETLNTLIYIFIEILKMLHPFIPFVTEDIYQKLNLKKSILLEKYALLTYTKKDSYIELINTIIHRIREFRAQENLKINKVPLEIKLILNLKLHQSIDKNLTKINQFLFKIVNLKIIDVVSEKEFNAALTQNLILVSDNFVLEIKINEWLNKNITKKLQEELNFLNHEIKRSKSILSNKKFLENAKKEKINLEKAKLSNYEDKHLLLMKKIAKNK